MGSSAKALVISQGYEPMEIVTWQRAFTLIASGRARVLMEHEEETVRSAKAIFKVPAVLMVVTGFVMRHRPVRFSPSHVFARDAFRCAYCLFVAKKTNELTLDHVLPRSRGGRRSWENIVTACKDCNATKADRTPEEAKMPLRYRPHKPRWTPAVVLQLAQQDMPEVWKPYLGIE